MTIAIRLTLCAGVVLAAACGDNSKQCGEGTLDVAGRCIGEVVPPVVCAEGTKFDESTNTCVIDPTACQGGTVLVRGRCQDPTVDINPDLEEGAEPNGAGVGGEPSVAPAGVFTMPTIGTAGVILHGTITPQPDRDGDGVPEPDVDTFVVEATGPAVLEITADGINGLAAGFLVESEVIDLADWQRLAFSLTGDTARRTLFLPIAGRYLVGISDTRSLMLPRAVVGGDDTEYFVTVVQHPLTTPSTLTLTGGMAEQTGTLEPTTLDFYSFTLETARTDLVLSSSFEGTMGSIILLIDGQFAGFADEDKLLGASSDAVLPILGGVTGEVATIVIDHFLTTTTTPVPYALDIEAVSTLR